MSETPLDPWTLTPTEATAALAEMTAKYRGAPPSASPQNSAEAAARLDSLMNDPDWRGRYLSGDDAAARQEYSELTRLKLAGDKVDAVLAGTAVPQPFETVMKGELTTRTLMGAVADLRDTGISDATIKQIFDGKKITAQEAALAKQLKAKRMSDPEWTKRYLAGGQTEIREMRLIGILLTSEVEA